MTTTTTQTPPGAEESLRRRMLEAAQALILASGGLRVSLEGLSLNQVIKHAGVPRTSVYRIWPNGEAFHIDLMCYLAIPNWANPDTLGDETLLMLRQVVAERVGTLKTLTDRRALLADVAKAAVAENFRHLSGSPKWRNTVTLSVSALSLNSPEARERVLTALGAGELAWLNGMAEVYEDLATVVGATIREGLSFQALAFLLAATVDGLLIREHVQPELVHAPKVVSVQDGIPAQEWSLVCLSALCLFERSVEFAPDYDESAALATYLRRLASRAG